MGCSAPRRHDPLRCDHNKGSLMATKTLIRERPVAKPNAKSIKVRRIVCGSSNASNQLRALRDQLGAEGDMVSARHKRLTQAVFGKPLTPVEVVAKVCSDVRLRGLSAVLNYTERFDHVRLTPTT